MAAVKFSKQTVQPNPLEVDYWVDIKTDPYGSIWKYYNGNDWTNLSMGGNGGISPHDYYTKIQVNQLLNTKLDVSSSLYQPWLLEGENIVIDRKTNTISATGELAVNWVKIVNKPSNLVLADTVDVATITDPTELQMKLLADEITNESFIPVTFVFAVYDEKGNSLNNILTDLYTYLDQYKSDLTADVDSFKTETTTTVNSFKDDVTTDMSSFKTEITEGVDTFEQNVTEQVNNINTVVNSANTLSNNALIKSEQAIETANVAKNAVATLEGLLDTDLSAIVAAEVVTQVEQNKVDIQSILNSEKLLSKQEYKQLEQNGEIDLTKKYYIYDN